MTRIPSLFDRKSFCVLPIIHAFVKPDGRAGLCCMNGSERIGNTNDNTFQEIYSSNNTSLRTIREKMILNEELPESCQKICGKDDLYAHNSYRVESNKIFRKQFVEEFETLDQIINNEKYFYVDIRFSNLCNLRCIYCKPQESTRVAEIKKMHFSLLTSTGNDSNLLDFMQANLDHLVEINFAGGEPTIMKEHYDVLDMLIASNRVKDIKVRYNTNLQSLSLGKRNVIDYWKQFPKLHLAVSLDDIGERCEFTRDGSDWKELIENIKTVKQQVPHAFLTLNPVVTMFNIMYMPEIIEYYTTETKLFNLKDLWLMPVSGEETHCINVKALPADIKQQVVEHYKETGAIEISQLKSLLNDMMSKDWSDLLPDTRVFIRDIEQTRGKNFLKTYPELATIMDV